MNKKSIMIMALAMALVAALSIGGTLAWLTDSTDEVKNTFSPTTINIELDESDDLDLVMVPNKPLTKDPVATVKGGSEACYLFVKIEKSANFDSFLTYAIAEGWTQVTTTDGTLVYYRAVAKNTADQEFAILANNTVTVKANVTKAMMDGLTAETYPTMTFTAYAVQSEYLTTNNMTEIWALAQTQGN